MILVVCIFVLPLPLYRRGNQSLAFLYCNALPTFRPIIDQHIRGTCICTEDGIKNLVKNTRQFFWVCCSHKKRTETYILLKDETFWICVLSLCMCYSSHFLHAFIDRIDDHIFSSKNGPNDYWYVVALSQPGIKS